jgi:hypothetical protein
MIDATRSPRNVLMAIVIPDDETHFIGRRKFC